MAPKPESLSAVSAWLEEHGLIATPITPTSDWLKIDMPVGKANELLATEFSVYTHDDTGKQAIRTLSYSIPADLAGHLDLVHPTVACVLIFPSMITASDKALLADSPIRIRVYLPSKGTLVINGRGCSPREPATALIPKMG